MTKSGALEISPSSDALAYPIVGASGAGTEAAVSCCARTVGGDSAHAAASTIRPRRPRMALSEDLELPRVELEVRRSAATIGRECHGPECTMQDVFAGQRVVIVYRNSRSTMEANPMSDVTEVARHRKLR